MDELGSETEALWQVAQTLSRRAAGARPRRLLPPLFFVTDPDRIPDPARIARRLPAGCGIIYRSFGRADAAAIAAELAEIANAQGLVLLIGADAGLAPQVDAHGVHLPERMLGEAPALRARRPDWLLTGAVHSEAALATAAEASLDAALLSPVFESRSPSAGPPLGVERFSALVLKAALPVYALGGVNARTAGELLHSGAKGLAAVEGLSGV